MWFEIYQIKQRQPPRFCSPTCRSVEHEIQENKDGELPKDITKAGAKRWQSVWSVAGAGGKPQRKTKNHYFKGGGARIREPDGTGD